MSPQATTMRIGELSRRVGVSTHVLRAWESRYGLLRPVRSPGGYRLYGPGDERRVQAVLALRAEGVPAAEACRTVLRRDRQAPDRDAGPPSGADRTADLQSTEQALEELLACLESFDEVGAQVILDRLVTTMNFEQFVVDALMPTMESVGALWAAGKLTVAHEHFASQLVRQRLATFSLAWASGTGPVAVLACPPGELHDLAPHCLGILLARRGWRVRFLGADTPMPDLVSACAAIGPDLVIVSAFAQQPLLEVASTLAELATRYPVALGGRGVTQAVVAATGIQPLPSDLTAAADLAASTGRRVQAAGP